MLKNLFPHLKAPTVAFSRKSRRFVFGEQWIGSVRKSAVDTERWITIGADKDEPGHGTHVKISGDGEIVAGPSGLADKGIRSLSDFGKKEGKKPISDDHRPWGASALANESSKQAISMADKKKKHELIRDHETAAISHEHAAKQHDAVGNTDQATSHRAAADAHRQTADKLRSKKEPQSNDDNEKPSNIRTDHSTHGINDKPESSPTVNKLEGKQEGNPSTSPVTPSPASPAKQPHEMTREDDKNPKESVDNPPNTASIMSGSGSESGKGNEGGKAEGGKVERNESENMTKIRQAVESPESVEWGDVSQAINTLKPDEIPEAENLVGADPSKRDRTYPTDHIHRELRPKHEEATAHVGHEDRLSLAKKLLADIGTTHSPNDVKSKWNNEIGGYRMSKPQQALLKRDLGIEPDADLGRFIDAPASKRSSELRRTGENLPPIENGTITLSRVRGNDQARSWEKGHIGMIHGQPYKITKVEMIGRGSSAKYHVTPATPEEYANRKASLRVGGQVGEAVKLPSGEWFHVKERKQQAVRDDDDTNREVIGHVHWSEGNYVPEDKAKKINEKFAKTPTGRTVRLGQLADETQKIGTHSYENPGLSGMTQLRGYGRQTMSGSDHLYSNGTHLMKVRSSYDDGPHYHVLPDAKLAKEALEHHEALSKEKV